MAKKPAFTGERKMSAHEKKKLAESIARKSAPSEHESPHYDRFGGLLDDFPRKALRIIELNAIAKAVEEEKRDLQGELNIMLQAVEESSVQGEDWIATRVESKGASRIDRLKLVEQSVAIEVIERATVQGASFSYVKVSPKEAE